MMLQLPNQIITKILTFLEIRELVTLSGTCKELNKKCKSIKPLSQVGILDRITLLDDIKDLPELFITNFFVSGRSWKNIIFSFHIDIENSKDFFLSWKPPNIIYNIEGFHPITFQEANKSLKMISSPYKLFSSPDYVSNTLTFLSLTQIFYLPKNIDFSSSSIKYLDLSLTNVEGITFRLKKNVEVVNLYGCNGLKNLKGFEMVKKLNIDLCEELENLCEIEKTEWLSIRYLKNIVDVSHLQNLKFIDISYSGVKDISKLKI